MTILHPAAYAYNSIELRKEKKKYKKINTKLINDLIFKLKQKDFVLMTLTDMSDLNINYYIYLLM